MTKNSKNDLTVVPTEVVVPINDEVELPTPPSDHTVDVGSIRPRSSFGKTMYYIDLNRHRSNKGPGQLLGIIRWMIDNGVTSPETARQGSEIGTLAVAEEYVVTAKLTGPVIFAYYIRRMEREHGVEHSVTIHAKTGKIMA